MTRYDTTTIHRYLDGVFEGLPLTPEVRDLKEELRGNLTARVTELEAGGLGATAASRKAIKELGDVKEIIAQLGVGKEPASSPRSSVVAAYNRNKVRPRPAYVVRTVALSLAIAGGVVAFVFGLLGGNPAVHPWIGPVALSLPIGVLIADTLRQETTSSHPLPTWRATGYGIAICLMVGGLGFIGQYIARPEENWRWMLLTGIPLAVVGIVLVSYLGATQTNRMKAWAKEVEGDWPDPIQARIEHNPAVGARFGIYSGVLWISATGAFVALSMQFGFKWSWLAFLVALLAQMILLARTILADDARTSDG